MGKIWDIQNYQVVKSGKNQRNIDPGLVLQHFTYMLPPCLNPQKRKSVRNSCYSVSHPSLRYPSGICSNLTFTHSLKCNPGYISCFNTIMTALVKDTPSFSCLFTEVLDSSSDPFSTLWPEISFFLVFILIPLI